MKALILVGGYGTRLRPLTLSVPKPLIHFCNRPIIEYQIKALAEVNVKHVILAVAYQPEAMREPLVELEKKYKIRITCSIEEEPLQTAGPIRLAERFLREDELDEEHPDLFFVFNSDIICEFPLKAMLDFHLRHRKEGTICVTDVQDPSMYGVIIHTPSTGKVRKFEEKPNSFVGNTINAGLYLFKREMIRRIEPRPTSIEKEIFPHMARCDELHCMKLNGYWADIGKPRDFLKGTRLYLQALSIKIKEEHPDQDIVELASGPGITGHVLIDPTVQIGEGCLIGPNVTIGPNCVIGDGVRISNTALMANVVVGDHTWMNESIIGWNSRIGKWVRIEGLTVLGKDVSVKNECFMNGAFVLPYKGISESVPQPGTIIM